MQRVGRKQNKSTELLTNNHINLNLTLKIILKLYLLVSLHRRIHKLYQQVNPEKKEYNYKQHLLFYTNLLP